MPFAACRPIGGGSGWTQSLAPAIRYAEEGVPVAPRVAFDWAEAPARPARPRARLLSDRRRSARDRRRFSARRVRPRCCAGSPQRAATGSTKARWPTTWSPRCARWAASTPLEDFAAHRCDYGDPVSGSYRGDRTGRASAERPGRDGDPDAQHPGAFRLAAMDPCGAERAHLEAEATKLAYDARDRFIADADSHDAAGPHAGTRNRRDAGRADRPGAGDADCRAADRGDPQDTIYITRRRPRPAWRCR